MGNCYQRTFFDVQVFNPTALSNRSTAVSSLYRQFECDKQRMYGQRVRDVEMGSFTPLVFSILWECVIQILLSLRDYVASLIAAQCDQPYM